MKRINYVVAIQVLALIAAITWIAPRAWTAYRNHGAIPQGGDGVLDSLSVEVLNVNTVDAERALIGSNATEADATDAQSIFSESDTGYTTAKITAGFFEATAGTSPAEWGVAVLGVADISARRGVGVYGEALVGDSTDAGDAIGGYFLSDDTHQGVNIAVYASASNGNTSYAYDSDVGLFRQAGAASFLASLSTGETITINSVGGIDQYRTAAGDGAVDVNVIRGLDGATVIYELLYDHSDSRLESNANFGVVGNLNASVRLDVPSGFFSSSAEAGSFKQWSSAANLIMKVKNDNDWQMHDKGDEIIWGMESDTGIMSLYGSSAPLTTGSIVWTDEAGTPVFGSISFDGSTMVIDSNTGDVEITAKAGNDIVLGNTVILPAIVEAPDGETISGGQLTKAVHSVDQAGVVTYFFSGVCNGEDGATVALVAGGTVVTVEYDTNASCAGTNTVCVDAAGALGDSATKCATLLSGALNSASVTDFNGYSTIGSVGVISVTENLNFDARESLANLAVTSATAIGEEPASKHHIFHCTHTVTATGEAILTLINKGALTVCSADGNSPIWWQCNVVDSAGEVVSIPNTIFNAEQAGTGKYLMVAKDSGGGHDIDDTDVINCLILSHH
jgi:hypothetical protein